MFQPQPRYRFDLTRRQSGAVLIPSGLIFLLVFGGWLFGLSYSVVTPLAALLALASVVVFRRVAWPRRVLVRHILRPATPVEADRLFDIHEAAMRSYVTETWGSWDDAEQYERWREHWFPGREVIDVDGEMAGFLDVEDRDDHVWVGNIELAPPFQGQQIGTTILTDIQREAAKRGLDVRLQVLKVNPARRLYERLGFELTGETETHYQMTWRVTRG